METELNLDHFNKLYEEILECVLCAAKTVAKKCGYQRSIALTGSGLAFGKQSYLSLVVTLSDMKRGDKLERD